MTSQQIAEINECIGFCMQEEKYKEEGQELKELLNKCMENPKLVGYLLHAVHEINTRRRIYER